jgi:hypothetical protein
MRAGGGAVAARQKIGGSFFFFPIKRVFFFPKGSKVAKTEQQRGGVMTLGFA